MANKEVYLYLLPIFAILIGTEFIVYKRRGLQFPYKEAFVSLLMAFVYVYANQQSLKLVAPINNFFYETRFFDIDMNNWWNWALLSVGLDFFYYWMHRSMHEIRWFWTGHSVHHSSVTMTFSGSYRLAITGIISGYFLFFIPLLLIGFSPSAVAIVYTLNLTYQFWLHTDLLPKLGWFERIFNTPSHHRVHHAINSEYIDKNYGGVFIIFDRMFGTFQAEKEEEPCVYGLVNKAPTLNPLKLFFQEWIAMFRDLAKSRSLLDIYFAIFARPGAFERRTALNPSPTSNKADDHRLAG